MRIGLITPGFSADESDWCIPALLDLVRELSSRHDLYVLTLRYPHQRRTYRVYDATVVALGGATAGGIHRLPVLTRALVALGRTHRQAPVGDAAALADAITYLQDKPQRLAEAGLSAQRLVASRYSLPQTAPAIETLYRMLVFSAGSGRE